MGYVYEIYEFYKGGWPKVKSQIVAGVYELPIE